MTTTPPAELIDLELARDVEALVPLAHHHSGKATPYLELPDPEWPEDHPRRRWNPYSLSAIAWDHCGRERCSCSKAVTRSTA